MAPLRSVWISDVHLGTRDARASYLYEFLSAIDSDFLYLVGDIIDLWKLDSGGCWPELNTDLIRLVVAKARGGTRVIYLSGNHDAPLRRYHGTCFYGIELHAEVVHATADGRQLLVIHGDQFDSAVRVSAWKLHLGNVLYDGLMMADRWVHQLRQRIGAEHWSLTGWLKQHSTEAGRYIAAFERAAAAAAANRGLDGVVCGHIHCARIADYAGIRYANCGDWVEHCTALAETPAGELQLIQWAERPVVVARESTPLPALA